VVTTTEDDPVNPPQGSLRYGATRVGASPSSLGLPLTPVHTSLSWVPRPAPHTAPLTAVFPVLCSFHYFCLVQEGPLWIVFAGDMEFRLQYELYVPKHEWTPADCRSHHGVPYTASAVQEGPLWIVFAGDMEFRLQYELYVSSHKTIDGRGAKVSFSNGQCIELLV